MSNRRLLIPLLFVTAIIGLTAVSVFAAQPDDQYDHQVSLLQQKFEFFGGPSLKNAFVILFLSIGPLGIIPAFAKLTANADTKLKNKLAFRGFWISTVTIMAVATIGQGMVANYRISLNALLTAAGLILAIVAMRSILTPYGRQQDAKPPPEKPKLSMALSPLSFPTIVPPFSIAIVLLLMIIGKRVDANVHLMLAIIAIFMVLDYLGMRYSRGILKVLRPEILQVLGAVLSVLKLGIGITWIYGGIALETGSILKVLGF